MTQRLKPGAYLIHNGQLRTVSRIDRGVTVSGGDLVWMGEETLYGLGIERALEELSPVQKGYTYYRDGHRAEVLSLHQYHPDEPITMQYRFDDIDDPFVCTLEAFMKHYLDNPDSPFPVGSKVRFRNDVTYTVTSEYDGELLELVPDDGSEKLNFSPDFFELVSPPPPEKGSVWRYGDRNVLIREVHDGYVYYTDSDGSVAAVTLKQFGRAFKPYE